MRIAHNPTDLFVEGTISEGQYTKKKMQEVRAKLEEKLMVELTKKVAAHLRISGR